MMGKYESRLSGTILFPAVELLDRMIEAANFPHFFAAHVSFGTFLASRKVPKDFLLQEKDMRDCKSFSAHSPQRTNPFFIPLVD